MITSAFAKFIDPFSTGPGLNRIDLVYSRRSVVLEFLNIPVPPATIDFVSFALTSNQLAGAKLLNAVELDPRATHLLSFFLGQPFASIPNDLDLFSPEALTAFYEIGFSGANIQRLTLENRLDEIRAGGGSVSLATGGGTVGLENTAGDGKTSKKPVEPVLQPIYQPRFDI